MSHTHTAFIEASAERKVMHSKQARVGRKHYRAHSYYERLNVNRCTRTFMRQGLEVRSTKCTAMSWMCNVGYHTQLEGNG